MSGLPSIGVTACTRQSGLLIPPFPAELPDLAGFFANTDQLPVSTSSTTLEPYHYSGVSGLSGIAQTPADANSTLQSGAHASKTA